MLVCEDKIKTIFTAKEAGLKICSGGIISLGESLEDRIDLAFEISALPIDCVLLIF
ncbi:hypothetical protein [endosymbiont 'TC1' of Trimyema compressum]|uniref:hypothetical protein n=1 Tax=endosymbiont 'TC1' of Trimyema compressum TaxID=243899 RepID=UPI000A452CC2|nr:hypothetical protein [endosymbiont 'TC1' of Trimyema compressum]